MVETTEAIRIQLQFEADQAEKKSKSMERQLLALEKRFDPLARATKRFEAGVKTLEKNLEAGKIDAERYEVGLANLSREFDNAKVKAMGAGAAVANMNAPVSGLTGIMNRNRAVFQQAGYQVGDFAVQVQGGQSAITAFTQQGSQMLGVFGAYGAIAGAALAIGAPLIASFVGGGEEAEEYADVVERLRVALDTYKGAADLARLSTEELTEQFGRGGEAARQSLEVLADVAQQSALHELTVAAAALSQEFSGMFENLGAIANMTDAQREVTAGLDQISFGLGLTIDQALDLRSTLDEIGAANGPEEVSDAARGLNDTLLAVFGSLEAMPDEFQAIAEAAANADVTAAELQATIEDTVFTVADLVTTANAVDFSAATNSATAMLGVLQQAYATAAALAASEIRTGGASTTELADRASQYGQYNIGRTAFDQAASEIRYSVPSVPSVPDTPAGSSRGRSSGGGGSSTATDAAREAERKRNQDLRDAERILNSLFTAQDTYNDALDHATYLFEQGDLPLDAAVAHVKELQEELRNAEFGGIISEIETFSASLGDAIVNGDSLGDVIGNTFDQIASDIISSQVNDLILQVVESMGLLSSVTGSGGGGLFGSIASGLFGGGASASTGITIPSAISSLIPAYASGTNNHPGGLARIHDGAGGEIVDLPNGTRVYPHDISKSMAGNVSNSGGNSGSGTILLDLRTDSSVITDIAGNTTGMAIAQNDRANDERFNARSSKYLNNRRRRGA